MTATVNEITLATITPLTYDVISRTFGVIAIVLLLALLVAREFVRGTRHNQDAAWTRAFDVATLPLLLTFGFVVVMRFVTLLL